VLEYAEKINYPPILFH